MRAKRIVVLVTREGLGTVRPEDRAFGLEMMDRFLHQFENRAERPEAILLYTEGVRLATRGSPALLALRILADLGVEVVACRTCLERFGLLEEVAVGRVGTMTEIVDRLTAADSVLTV